MIREEATPLPGSSKSKTGVKDKPRAIAVQGYLHQTQQVERAPGSNELHPRSIRKPSQQQKQPERGVETTFGPIAKAHPEDRCMLGEQYPGAEPK